MLFLTNGNGPPGSTGRLLRSSDYGAHWEDVNLPGPLNSTPWCVSSHRDHPELVFAVSNLGQIFRSTDGGAHWEKLSREFGEVRALAMVGGSSHQSRSIVDALAMPGVADIEFDPPRMR